VTSLELGDKDGSRCLPHRRDWGATQDQRSTQLVFCDLSTPDPERFNVYHDLRSKLVRAGVPEREIAFVHNAETDTPKKLLFDAVNAGRVTITARIDREDGRRHERTAPARGAPSPGCALAAPRYRAARWSSRQEIQRASEPSASILARCLFGLCNLPRQVANLPTDVALLIGVNGA
jgi:hypothetical protein